MLPPRSQPAARFNVLLTEDQPHSPGHWSVQLPRLLEPQGVTAFRARTGREAIALASRHPIHAAVIDLNTPMGESSTSSGGTSGDAGMWIIELFQRLPARPPVVVVHNRAYSQREVARLMGEALRLGVFSVLPKPFELEQLLGVFQRLVERQYRGSWPTAPEKNPDPAAENPDRRDKTGPASSESAPASGRADSAPPGRTSLRGGAIGFSWLLRLRRPPVSPAPPPLGHRSGPEHPN